MSETAAEKPAFRDAMKRRRCLIPTDGFYEWKKLGTKEKQPYNFGMIDDSVFAFAGLWERWRDPAGEFLETCTILTTKPNSLVADVHDRMPVILKPEDYDLWLDPGVTDPALVADTLKPFDPRSMKKYPVSTRVNRAENDDQRVRKRFRSQIQPSCCSETHGPSNNLQPVARENVTHSKLTGKSVAMRFVRPAPEHPARLLAAR